MSITRRSLLRALPSLPLAGNEIKRQVAKLAGASVIGGERMIAPGMGGIPDYGEGGTTLRGRALATLLRTIGIPDWKRKEFRNEARMYRQLDPDIASMRSISVSTALRMQWERNERRAEERMFSWLEGDDDRQSFIKRHGASWF